ncbi:uncharacterized protein N7500_001581 [Penicillium coprophilum]|uniref:uncharacterized protein n=1 Tax=Penicillium coprophilum TaxID=36646 RepID=UPI0023A70CC4|nr:uncharacterized protein N7500_001581 [Penicillium coprophilum]KAJ5173650.1 hypothetical protein N7500_001581 [Penicillium coprophilum]
MSRYHRNLEPMGTTWRSTSAFARPGLHWLAKLNPATRNMKDPSTTPRIDAKRAILRRATAD